MTATTLKRSGITDDLPMAGCIHDYRLLDMQGRTTYAGDGSATSIMVARFFCARCLHIEPRTV